MKTDNMIFVFGSNLAGIHGAGAAAYARNYRGAKLGVAEGRTGQSYAIPTKDKQIKKALPYELIRTYVHNFMEYARERPQLHFQVTRIGCGLAGLRDEDIAPMFEPSPVNCYFDNKWQSYLSPDFRRYWGTF